MVATYNRLIRLLVYLSLSALFLATPTSDARAQQACCGCLCVDAQWSCAADTCTDARGAVDELGPEAGFFELDPGFIGLAAAGRARMFYAFQPADQAPEQKPLLLFFQGGPFAAMLPLWGGNTGPNTLDPTRTAGAPIAKNPYSWTRFANLLYVDPPVAGFSYIAKGDDPTGSADSALSWAEAAAYTQVLLRFLRHHPQLAQNRVVLVGESYGGARAIFIASQLLRYRALAGQRTSFDGAKLAAEIEAHAALTLGPAPQGGFSPAEMGELFAQILIQPALASWRMRAPSAAASAKNRDANQRFDRMLSALLQPSVFDQLTGVAGASIRWMRGEERRAQQGRFRRATSLSGGRAPSEDAFAGAFGALSQQQPYYRLFVSYGVGAWRDTTSGFVDALHHVPSFMTNAGNDHVVDTERIAADLGRLPGVASATRRRVDGHLERVDLTFGDGAARSLHFPSYPNSGHSVSLFEPAQFADDVQRWLAGLEP